MSRSNPQPTNPAKRFFKWSGSKGTLGYYDKEQQKEVEVKLPFTFLVLDELATISGFCEQDTSNYWSNEVRNVSREQLTVKTSHGTKQSGLYKDLTDVRSKGAKYAKSIYIAYKEQGVFVIGNLKASGAALTAWIEFGNKHVVSMGKVTLTGSEEAKKGATTYYIPTFSWDHADTDEDEIAKELDKELQMYLSQYLAEPAEDTWHEDAEQRAADSGYEKFKRSRPAKKPEVEDPDFGSMLEKGLEADGIDLNDIPF
jgi:hypothetical protein